MATGVTVVFEVKPESGEAFAKLAGAIASDVRQEPGCEMYDLFESIERDGRFVLVERWASDADLETHLKAPSMAAMGKVAPLLAGAPSITRYPVG